MFEWKVEDLKLYNEKDGTFFLKNNKIFSCESHVSREDKIAFVDSMQNGKLSYIIGIIDKFEKEKDNMPKNSWGSVKTLSLKAFLKRNDPRKVFNNDYDYGKYYILGMKRNIISSRYKSTDDLYEDIVDEVFHRQLLECEYKEKQYFLQHDEYSILKKQLCERKYNTTFGVKISFWSSGKICVYDDNDREREITIDEIKELLEKYDKLDALVEELTKETHIKY